MDCGILFQKKLPIMLGQNLLRLVRNEGIATWLDDDYGYCNYVALIMVEIIIKNFTRVQFNNI